MNGGPAGRNPCSPSQPNSAGNALSTASAIPSIVTRSRMPTYGCSARSSIPGSGMSVPPFDRFSP